MQSHLTKNVRNLKICMKNIIVMETSHIVLGSFTLFFFFFLGKAQICAPNDTVLCMIPALGKPY